MNKAVGGKPVMLDASLMACLSKINLISLFIDESRHFDQFCY
jgi:hypothetical protein